MGLLFPSLELIQCHVTIALVSLMLQNITRSCSRSRSIIKEYPLLLVVLGVGCIRRCISHFVLESSSGTGSIMARKGGVSNVMDHTTQVIFSRENLIRIPSVWADRKRLLQEDLRLGARTNRYDGVAKQMAKNN